jgi:protein ImuB
VRPKVQSPRNDPPIVLVRTVASRQVIVAANESASQQQIRPGMTLAEARAICAAVEHVEHDSYRDAVALEALGRWLMRFSPVVALPSLPLPPGEGQGEDFGSLSRG